MRKLLFIAYYYPPRPGIGSQRPYRLSKYITGFGWEPIILTAKLPGDPPEGIKVIETDYKDYLAIIKGKIGVNPVEGLQAQMGLASSNTNNYTSWKSKSIKLVKEIINYPDDNRGWYHLALSAASQLVSAEKVDAIISTSGPVTCHLIARKLKQRYRIPWIADLRDLWTQNHFYNKFDLIKYFERRLELKTLIDADAVVAVTDRFVDDLKTLHRDKQIVCITNGYDADDFPETAPELTNKFTITHTGRLYDGKRNPSLLFEAVAQLLNENRVSSGLLELRFYGRVQQWLKDMIKKYDLQNVVNCCGLLPREEALKKQKESHVLLLVLDSTNKEEGVYPAKIFEYLGAKRPIIAIGGEGGVVKELLEENSAGTFTANIDDLKTILVTYYEEYMKYGGVKCCTNSNINNYAYKFITEKYAKLLNEVVSI